MRGYIYSIVVLSAVIGVIFSLTPKSQGLRKHLRFISSVCLLCVLTSPAAELVDELFSMGKDLAGSVSQSEKELQDKYEGIFDDYLEGKYGENIGQAVKDALYDKFNIKNENCRVATEFSYSEKDGLKTPRKITVVLSGRAIYVDPLKVKDFISEVFGCEAEVAME